jgi:outer membrane protein insertion porin family
MRLLPALAAILASLTLPATLQAQDPPAAAFVGQPIASVTLVVDGRELSDPSLERLVDTREGDPLSMTAVRETLTHLFSIGRFQDIRLEATETPGGVALRYLLTPVRNVSRIAFTGTLGLSERELRRAVTERFSATPAVGRADAAARALEQVLARRGYLRPRVRPFLDVRSDSDRATLTFEVDAGPRAQIGTVEVSGGTEPAGRLAGRLGLVSGRPYDREQVEQRLARHVQSLRNRGYYEAAADFEARPRDEDRFVDLDVELQQGPLVRLAFEGDPLPRERIPDLVPVEREGSVDLDLLEDAERRVRDFLHEQGYIDATAVHRRELRDGILTITFLVRRGPRFIVESTEISGNASFPIERLRDFVQLRRGEPYVASRLDADLVAIRNFYLRQGFPEAAVEAPAPTETPPPGPGEPGRVAIRIAISEGPLVRVGAIRFEGNVALTDEQLRAAMRVVPGAPYYEPAVVTDREAVLLAYLNEGFQGATIDRVERQFTAEGQIVDLVFHIREGTLVLVDHIVIVGNTRTSAETIRRELLIREGQPLGLADLIESRRRLSALGLFRRVRITEVPHGDEPRRDVIIAVEEADRTTVAYGAGLEAATRSFFGPGGEVDDRLEVAPRGSFEIGRRNLFGRNRSIHLFSRISFRPRGESIEAPDARGYGFNEYRVVTTYREIGAFQRNADVAVSAFSEQAIRTSFNFRRHGMNAELLRRLSPRVRFNTRYSLGRTQLFDERLSQDEQLDVDRLFPQVRLSSVTVSVYRDTRDDPLDPTRGTLLGTDSELAPRLIGSQVGFGKTFAQAFGFRTLSARRGLVLASAVRVGLARGFERRIGETGVVVDLPASERFFAGGSTTVRGFSLDRLGAPATIAETGFPRGGNALLVLNAELRAPLWRDLGVVGFVDGGNVFARAEDFDLSEIRVTPGFGLRYRSPIGPVRFDLGFKLRRRELTPGRLESRTAFHISVGHAF